MEHRLSAVLELKDKFSSKIRSASLEFKKFTNDSKQTNGAMQNTASSIKNTAKSLATFATAFGAFKLASASFSFIKDAYIGYAELNQVLVKNGAIMKATAEDNKKLKEQVLELGKVMPFTAKEVAEAQKYQAMAGMKTNEILELTPKLLKLSIASGEDLARTSDILTDNMSAFGLELKETERFMDVMATTANNTNTSIGELGEAYKYVAATSRNFESLEEVNILLGILANNGIKGSIAGRNLAAIFSRLSKTTPDMDKALKKVGVSLYDNTGKFKGLRNFLNELKPAMSKMNEEQRNFFLTTIAGTEGMKLFASILGYSKEGMDSLEKAMKNANGATNEIYDKMKDTPQNKIKALGSAWENLKLKIAEAGSPAITGMIEDLTQKVIDLSSSDTFSKENVEAFFSAIREGTKGAIDVIEGLLLLLKPVVWGLKAISFTAKIGKIVGNEAGKRIMQSQIADKYMDKGLDYGSAYEAARKEMEYNERTKKFTPEQRQKELTDLNEEINKAYLSKNYGYAGIKYEDMEKERKRVEGTNTPISSYQPNISLNFGGVIVNNEDDIKKIAEKIGKETGEKVTEEAFINLNNFFNTGLQTQM